jgi:hypothetical protein
MARQLKVLGQRLPRGKRVMSGKAARWKLLRGESKRPLKASLLSIFKVGGQRIAVFRLI